jgi:hypothetical protein
MNVKFIQHICKFWSLRPIMQLYCFFLYILRFRLAMATNSSRNMLFIFLHNRFVFWLKNPEFLKPKLFCRNMEESKKNINASFLRCCLIHHYRNTQSQRKVSFPFETDGRGRFSPRFYGTLFVQFTASQSRQLALLSHKCTERELVEKMKTGPLMMKIMVRRTKGWLNMVATELFVPRSGNYWNYNFVLGKI